MVGFDSFSNTQSRNIYNNISQNRATYIAFVFLQAVVERKVPTVELPTGDTLKTKKKVAVKPDKPVAIAKHQTRMKSTL